MPPARSSSEPGAPSASGDRSSRQDSGGIVVVSGSYGAGHDVVADELVRRLAERGHVAQRLDIVRLLPLRLGVVLRWLYFTQLRLVPWLWGSTLRCLEPDGTASRGTRWLLGVVGRGLVEAVGDAGVVVSTHPFASQILGEARAGGRLFVSVLTYLTDASVHR